MITKKDFSEVPIVEKLLAKVDNCDEDYVNRISNEMFHSQPFFLTFLLGYRLDTTPLELEEIMKIYFLIWEYFQTSKDIHIIKVTEERYNKVEDKNIAMLQYADGESDAVERQNIYDADMGNLKSKALFEAIHLRCNSIPVLARMELKKKGLILIGIKSFIECFETI